MQAIGKIPTWRRLVTLYTQMRDVQMTAQQVMCKDVVLARARKRKNGLQERPVAILSYLLSADQ
jgi:hypothetical protein